MKKTITAIILTAMLAVSAVIPTFAAEYWTDSISFTATEGTAVIDGKVDDAWANAEAIEMKLNDDKLDAEGYVSYQGEWSADGRDDADYMGTTKFMYDDKNLYIIEDRVDNKVVLTGIADEAYNTDGVLVFLQAGEEGTDVNPEGICHHIFYTAGKDGQIGGSVKVRVCNNTDASREILDIEGAQIVSTLTDKGYLVEMAIPWTMVQKQLPNFKGPKAGDKMGLAFVVADSDIDDGAFQKQFCYGIDMSIAPANGFDFGGWGELNFKAAPVVETTAAPETAPAAEVPAETPADVLTGAPTEAPQTSDVALSLFALVAALSAGSIALLKKKNNK